MLKRIRVNKLYKYVPTLLDQIDNRTGLEAGDIVRAIKSPPGCPPNGTMGHCYVGDRAGKFIGLVCCNSLQEVGKHDPA